MAASLAAAAMDVSSAAIQAAIDGFAGLPHRMEWVRSWHGVDFYNDSKGTNVGAVVKALEGFDRPVLLLLGGKDKLGSYEPLVEPLRRTGKAIFAYGDAGPKIHEALRQSIPARLFPDLEAAFREAVGRASTGDVVLLSPACSSFDQYESYGQRGNHFRKLAAGLAD